LLHKSNVLRIVTRDNHVINIEKKMGADDESVAVPEQSQTQGKAERGTREGEGCLSSLGDGHNSSKYHHH
jgi:hypothetical protein